MFRTISPEFLLKNPVFGVIVSVAARRTQKADRTKDHEKRMARKKVTMSDVAEEAGCSKATVSYCITHNRPISKETSRRVRAAIEKLGYHPESDRRSLGKKNIAILVNDLFLSFLNPFLDYITRKISDKGYIAQLYPLPPDFSRTPELIRNIGNTRNIAGILCMASVLESVDIFKWSHGIPSIIFIRDGCMLSPVQFNYRHCVKLALEHLEKLGHRNVLFITEKETVERLSVQAYFSELNENHRVNTRTLLPPRQPEESDLRTMSEELDAAYAEGFRAVIALNAFYSSLVYRWAARQKHPIPEELSVICLENSSLADWFIPRLTKIRVPVEEIATYTVETLIAKIGNQTLPSKKFQPYFIPGESTAPLR